MIQSTAQIWRRLGEPRPVRRHPIPFVQLLNEIPAAASGPHDQLLEPDRGMELPAKTKRVAVIGLGYVGWPLAVSAMRSGYRVLGVDTNSEHVRDLLDDPPDDVRTALRCDRMQVVTRPEEAAAGVDVIVICVPTPWDHLHDRPDLSAVEAAAATAGRMLRLGTLVSLESSTFPGTTEENVRPILERQSALVAGKDFWLAYSPERIDPGNEHYSLHNTPKVVGGFTEQCTQMAIDFYDDLVPQVVAARGLREAELSKILENTYRLVNISLINEIAVVARELGIDLRDALRCAATKPFGYEAFQPGPGVGGHCIPIDPLYLAYLVKEKLGRELQFVRLADEVNRQMAHVVVDWASALVGDLRQARVLLLGVSYKADVPDTRETPAARICRYLLSAGATVRYVDPYVPYWQVDGKLVPRVIDLHEGIRSCDVVILLQRHRALAYEPLEAASIPVLDMRGDLSSRGVER